MCFLRVVYIYDVIKYEGVKCKRFWVYASCLSLWVISLGQMISEWHWSNQEARGLLLAWPGIINPENHLHYHHLLSVFPAQQQGPSKSDRQTLIKAVRRGILLVTILISDHPRPPAASSSKAICELSSSSLDLGNTECGREGGGTQMVKSDSSNEPCNLQYGSDIWDHKNAASVTSTCERTRAILLTFRSMPFHVIIQIGGVISHQDPCWTLRRVSSVCGLSSSASLDRNGNEAMLCIYVTGGRPSVGRAWAADGGWWARVGGNGR